MTVLKRALTSPASIAAGGTIAVPGSPSAGDLMLAVFSSPLGSLKEQGVMPGWHKYNQASLYDANYLDLYYRISSGSEPATYTTNFSATVTGAMIVVYSDASAHVNIDAIATDIRSSSTSIIFPSITLSAAGLLLNFGVLDSSFACTPPGGSTEEMDGPSSTAGRIYLLSESRSSGATGTRTATASNAESCEVLSLAVIDAPFVYPLSPVFRDRTIGGQSNSVTSKVIAATPNLTVGDLMVLHVGFQTSSPSFTISGGAVTWTPVTNGEITGNNSIHTFYGVAAAGDIGASYTISWTGAKSVNAALTAYYSPAGYPLTVGSAVNQTNAAAANIPFPTLTPSVNDSLIVWLASNDNSTTSIWDTSATKGAHHYKDGTNINLHGFTEYAATNGATGTRTATIGGASNNSKVVGFAIAELLTPGDPSSLTATAASSSAIGLTWTDTSTFETGFKVDHSTDGSSWSLLATLAANTTTYNHTGLSEYTIHYYRVYAYTGGGVSGFSNVANATTSVIAPTGLTATPNGSTAIDLSWSDPSTTELGSSIEASLSSISGFVEIATVGPNVTSYTHSGLTPNATYYHKVRNFR